MLLYYVQPHFWPCITDFVVCTTCGLEGLRQGDEQLLCIVAPFSKHTSSHICFELSFSCFTVFDLYKECFTTTGTFSDGIPLLTAIDSQLQINTLPHLVKPHVGSMFSDVFILMGHTVFAWI